MKLNSKDGSALILVFCAPFGALAAFVAAGLWFSYYWPGSLFWGIVGMVWTYCYCWARLHILKKK